MERGREKFPELRAGHFYLITNPIVRTVKVRLQDSESQAPQGHNEEFYLEMLREHQHSPA